MGTLSKLRHRKLKLLEQVTPEQQELIDALKENGWSDVDESGNVITAREYANPKPDFDYKKVGVVVLRKSKAAANTGSGNINKSFDCIRNVKTAFNIKLYKSRTTPTESIYELLTDFIDGEATQINYYIDGKIELKKRSSSEVVYKGTWQCMGTDGFKICWDGKCSPVYMGVETGVNVLANDQSCCTGTSGTNGTSGSSGTSGNASTSGGGSLSFSCPSGYNLPCPTLDEVRNCKKSFKECMKCSEIKELQQIPALAYFIEEIQDRDNKIKKFDEFFGPIMKEAVAATQQYRDLEVDGIIGCKTLKSLEDSPDLEETASDETDQVDDDTDKPVSPDVEKVEDNKSNVRVVKPSFQVDRSFFNPNDEW